ncbi:hypothetical protein EYF80_019476 [Liparis tanakae]|uniref:Uncharacterized protein n=1 Tax=Liparis tanakae TaxID=230148 RepID=A0A4Z2HZ81_9TELE|nr:hypothetical protein EYF80_019476 [Liparis tanakae]
MSSDAAPLFTDQVTDSLCVSPRPSFDTSQVLPPDICSPPHESVEKPASSGFTSAIFSSTSLSSMRATSMSPDATRLLSDLWE